MSAKHFESLAAIAANILVAARETGGEDYYAVMYENAYLPIVELCKRENPRFDHSRFSFRVAQLMDSNHG